MIKNVYFYRNGHCISTSLNFLGGGGVVDSLWVVSFMDVHKSCICFHIWNPILTDRNHLFVHS